MSRKTLSNWMVQAACGGVLVAGLSFVLGAATPSSASPAAQAQATGVSPKGGCEPGFSGSPDTKCEDVNECAVSNGGCHRLTGCENTPGSRTCGGCPKGHHRGGYGGRFDAHKWAP